MAKWRINSDSFGSTPINFALVLVILRIILHSLYKHLFPLVHLMKPVNLVKVFELWITGKKNYFFWQIFLLCPFYLKLERLSSDKFNI